MRKMITMMVTALLMSHNCKQEKQLLADWSWKGTYWNNTGSSQRHKVKDWKIRFWKQARITRIQVANINHTEPGGRDCSEHTMPCLALKLKSRVNGNFATGAHRNLLLLQLPCPSFFETLVSVSGYCFCQTKPTSPLYLSFKGPGKVLT